MQKNNTYKFKYTNLTPNQKIIHFNFIKMKEYTNFFYKGKFQIFCM